MCSTELTQNTSSQPIFVSINWIKGKHLSRTGALTINTFLVFEHHRLCTVKVKVKQNVLIFSLFIPAVFKVRLSVILMYINSQNTAVYSAIS